MEETVKHRGPRLWRETKHELRGSQRGLIRALPGQAWVVIRAESGEAEVTFAPLVASRGRPRGKAVTRAITAGTEKVFVTDRDIKLRPRGAVVVGVEIWRRPKEAEP